MKHDFILGEDGESEEETNPCIHCDLPATDGGECCDDHKGVDDADEVRLSRGW
jgi:hypothetical protein